MPRSVRIRKVRYRNIGSGRSEVAYVVLPEIGCVFCGLTHLSRGTSTINAAEMIVAAIAAAAKLNTLTTEFFDLQTGIMYSEAGVPTGQFAFFRLLPGNTRGACCVGGWLEETCPDVVVSLFANQIGPQPHQVPDGFALEASR